jgi:hypothetical protein
LKVPPLLKLTRETQLPRGVVVELLVLVEQGPAQRTTPRTWKLWGMVDSLRTQSVWPTLRLT